MSELQYARNPWPGRALRGSILLAIIAGALLALYIVVASIRLYTVPHGSIEISVPYSRYLAGESISVTVTNNFSTPISITNGCPNEPLAVYRLEGNTWQRIHDVATDGICDSELYRYRTIDISPQKSVTTTFDDWPNLFKEPGRYRIALQVHYYNAVPFQEFEVITKPEVKSPESTPQSTTPATAPTPAPVQQNDDNHENDEPPEHEENEVDD